MQKRDLTPAFNEMVLNYFQVFELLPVNYYRIFLVSILLTNISKKMLNFDSLMFNKEFFFKI